MQIEFTHLIFTVSFNNIINIVFMDTNLEKAIALLTFNQEPYFISEDEESAFTDYASFDEAIKAWEDSKTDETFEQWCFDTLTPVEPYDEDDYNHDYNVYTDDEANARWEEELDSYLEDCIYPELQGNLKNYFDDEAWKSDARMDGRGHAINKYDGSEDVVEVNGTSYYIYRQN